MSEGKNINKYSWLPSIIRHDYVRKLIALCFATLLWWKISMQIGVEEVIRNVPVNIVTAENTVNLDENVKYVDVTVRGRSQRRLNLMTPDDFKMELEVGDNVYSPGKPVNFKILKSASISKPIAISITRINPENIVLHFDRKISRDLPVNARFTGMTPEDFACGEVKLTPSTVKITGPESLLAAMIKVQTEPVVLDQRTIEDFEFRAKISEPHKKVTVLPPSVLVSVEIYRKYDTRTFSGLPISILNSVNSGLIVKRISPTNADVTAGGVKSSLETMNGGEILPLLDVSSLKEAGISKVKLGCHITIPGIKVNSITPSEVEVEIQKEK